MPSRYIESSDISVADLRKLLEGVPDEGRVFITRREIYGPEVEIYWK